MTLDTNFWELMWETAETIGGYVLPQVAPQYRQSPFANMKGGFFITFAIRYAPEPMSLERLRRRNPYAHDEMFYKAIRNLQQAGYLTGDLIATYKAIHEYNQFITLQNQAINAIDKFEDEDMQHFADYIYRMVMKAAQSTIPEPRCLRDALYRKAPADASHLLFANEGIWQLNAFRDDCHHAAWKPLGLAGKTWELFTYLWRGEVDTAQTMAEKATHHYFSADAYQESLDELCQQGWVYKKDKSYQLTHEGYSLREKIEAQTNTLFFAAFSMLSETEIENLRLLLLDIRNTLAQA